MALAVAFHRNALQNSARFRPCDGRGGFAFLRACKSRSIKRKTFLVSVDYTGAGVFVHQFDRAVCSGWFNPGCLSHPRRRTSFPEQFRTTDAPRSLAHSRDVAVAKSNHRRVSAHFLSKRRGFARSSYRSMNAACPTQTFKTQTMKPKSIITIAAIALLPIAGFTQTP